jgi:beta-phosphoglucomutase-like phosphatase (HAD superfamily)
MFGILFDLDGTLADSDSIHFQAWQKILGERNAHKPLIDREFYDENISGRKI